MRGNKILEKICHNLMEVNCTNGLIKTALVFKLAGTSRFSSNFHIFLKLIESEHEIFLVCFAVRGILDPDHGTYKDLEKGTVMLIGDAVQHRMVDIEYEPNDLSEYKNRTPILSISRLKATLDLS